MNGERYGRTTVRGKFRPFHPPFRGVDGTENGKIIFRGIQVIDETAEWDGAINQLVRFRDYTSK